MQRALELVGVLDHVDEITPHANGMLTIRCSDSVFSIEGDRVCMK